MKRPLVSAFLSGCIAAGFVALVAYEYVPVSIAVALALAGFGFGYLGALRQRTSELRATNLEFQTSAGAFSRSRALRYQGQISSLSNIAAVGLKMSPPAFTRC